MGFFRFLTIVKADNLIYFMNFHFNLHYKTVYGEQIGIEYCFGKSVGKTEILLLNTFDGENWSGQLHTEDTVQYKYLLIKDHEVVAKEWGGFRKSASSKSSRTIQNDQWRARDQYDNAFLSTAFTQAILKRSKPTKKTTKRNQETNEVQFILSSATINTDLIYGILGSIPALGSWVKAIPMDDAFFPQWSASVGVDQSVSYFEYKYVIINPKDGNIVAWEYGDNRRFFQVFNDDVPSKTIVSDNHFRHADSVWKGAGVAIPVFSLRSTQGLGIGEYTDLKLLTDWTHDVGMKMIQVLPVNDTIATKTWVDSYPYASISVFALHPLYINIQQIAPFKDKKVQAEFAKDQKALHALETVDFEKVLQAKFKYLSILFEQEYDTWLKDKDYLQFKNQNKDWLEQYAAFCHLRDIHKTSNFNLWPEYSVFSDEVTQKLCSTAYSRYKEIAFYYFIQYHADRQLQGARDYARTKGVVIKGDLPIGIYRYSCDAWVAPELYNMNGQAGAPPDDYAVLGQNWGFPTYNWEVMAKDNFAWWQKRMQQLNRYFDALRIDHILGFFRIWQIPTNQVQGTMGLFNPRLPLSRTELQNYGITGDLTRYTIPYITNESLLNAFGHDVEEVFEVFFSRNAEGKIVFKSSFDNQQKINHFTNQNARFEKFEKALLGMMSEILLISEPDSDGQYFNPRITLSTTYSYSQLDQYTKAKFDQLYNDYFYIRHDEYWKQQALWKLPAILDASDMLICGEDLGMIPKSVPGVMKAMNIMSLEIQRMPKGNNKFGQVRQYPYFSVCSPSCHDMSTIRGWWQGDHDLAKDFYYNYLHWQGLTPMECNTDIVTTIVEDHMASPSMLAIFPIQDLVGMDGTLRKADAASEQINEPANPKHYWRYRFHLDIETLQKSEAFNIKIKDMVQKYGR